MRLERIELSSFSKRENAMNRRLISGLTVLAALCLPCWAAGQSIPIEVTVTQIGSTARLKISLTNRSEADLSVYSSQLPWGNTHSMIIVPVSLSGSNEVITNVGLIDDPGPGTTVLRANEALLGE